MSIDKQKEIFSKNLRNLLSQCEKTQLEVAKGIGVSPQTFNTWCQGIAYPRMPKVQRLADYFGVPVSALVEPKIHFEWQHQIFSESSTTPTLSPDAETLLSDYEKLNDLGKKRARDDVADLTQHPKYALSQENIPVAAHEHSDATPEEIASDDDIMNDDNRWR